MLWALFILFIYFYVDSISVSSNITSCLDLTAISLTTNEIRPGEKRKKMKPILTLFGVGFLTSEIVFWPDNGRNHIFSIKNIVFC